MVSSSNSLHYSPLYPPYVFVDKNRIILMGYSHCTAEFCMLCGNRWKTCDCPWFNFQAVDDDRLNHMRVPCEINHPNQPHGAGFAAQPRRRQRQVQAPPQGPVGVLQDNLDRMQDFIRQEQVNPQLRQRERQRREQAAQRQQVTCQQEMESRRRQEREDAEIARRIAER